MPVANIIVGSGKTVENKKSEFIYLFCLVLLISNNIIWFVFN